MVFGPLVHESPQLDLKGTVTNVLGSYRLTPGVGRPERVARLRRYVEGRGTGGDAIAQIARSNSGPKRFLDEFAQFSTYQPICET
jgi:hypothetical protein